MKQKVRPVGMLVHRKTTQLRQIQGVRHTRKLDVYNRQCEWLTYVWVCVSCPTGLLFNNVAIFPEHITEHGEYSVVIDSDSCHNYKNKVHVFINCLYSSMNTSCLAHEVALRSPTAGCGQHLSTQDGKHSLNPALSVQTNICRLLPWWVSRPYPAPTAVIHRSISQSRHYGIPAPRIPCFTTRHAGPTNPGASGTKTSAHLFLRWKRDCHVMGGVGLWIQHRGCC